MDGDGSGDRGDLDPDDAFLKDPLIDGGEVERVSVLDDEESPNPLRPIRLISSGWKRPLRFCLFACSTVSEPTEATQTNASGCLTLNLATRSCRIKSSSSSPAKSE